jgi:hypothetical protein
MICLARVPLNYRLQAESGYEAKLPVLCHVERHVQLLGNHGV